MSQILIQNGRLIDPANGKDGVCDVLLAGGVIKKVGVDLPVMPDTFRIDATGKVVMPGFIDLHVHLRDPGFTYKETIQTGAMAAAAGGVTTICAMPNTDPVIDTKERVKDILFRAKTAPVHVLPVGAVTKAQAGKELSDMEQMALSGAVAFSEDGKSVADASLYREALTVAAQVNLPVFAHCEDKTIAANGVIHDGKKAKEFHLPGIPGAAEDVIVARDILLSADAGNRLHLCHCSTKRSVKMLAYAKENGLLVTGEVCPHHFILSDEDITQDHGRFKMNPPLREKSDVAALREALKDGTVDVIATDHAPHAKKEKDCSFTEAAFGVVGLETSFALSYTALVKEGILTLSELVEKMSVNPAKIIGSKKGNLEKGRVADVVIADINTPYSIDPNTFYSKGKSTPFAGREVFGRIDVTIVDGKVVYQRDVTAP